MQDIKIREEKMKEKRRHTPRRDFVKEIASRFPLVLYKNAGLVSRYPQTDRVKKIMKSLEYESTRESFTKYGLEYDFSKNFFDNLKNVVALCEYPSLITYGGLENSDFADIVHNTKNAYLVFNTVWDNENILYSSCIKDKCSNVLNGVMIRDASENIYMAAGVIKSYNVFFSKYIVNSNNIWFSANLMGCAECIACDGLINQNYCIHNKQLTKEEYEVQKKDILQKKEAFMSRYDNGSFGTNLGSIGSEGNFIVNSENIKNGTMVYQVKEGNNLVLAGSIKGNERMYDVFIGGSNVSNDYYGASGSGSSQNLYICDSIGFSSNLYYCQSVSNCSYCLGCVGLKNKSFCILNTQYTKEERFELANKIFEQMDNDGLLGQFFPGSMSPFYFNDTAAYLVDDTFTKEEVTKEGYLRRDEEIKVDMPTNTEVITIHDIHNFQGFDTAGERKISPEILKKVIRDDKGNMYRIVPMELEFLQKHGLPLPELHWLERIKLGFKFK